MQSKSIDQNFWLKSEQILIEMDEKMLQWMPGFWTTSME